MRKSRTLRLGAFLIAATLSTTTGGAQNGQDSPIHFIGSYVEVIGTGKPPDSEKGPGGYPLARRAALVDAYRNIAEATRGIRLDSQTVNDMQKVVSDRVVAAVSASIQACRVMDGEESLTANYNRQGYVTLTCRADLTGSAGVMGPIMDVVTPEVRKKLDDQKLPAYTPPAAPLAQAQAPDYDGLIIRVPAQFKPSLFPKIRTDKGEVVYSMKDVSLEMQKNRGLASYTDDVGKATASLRAIGAQTILTIDGALYLDTEAQVKADDAAKIAGATRKTSFLNSARVVFVIGKPS